MPDGPPQRSRIDARCVDESEAPYDLVRKMRASFMVLGPLLARFGSAAGLGAGRLRDRRAARRSAPEGSRSARAPRSSSTTATSRPPARRLVGARIAFDLTTVNGTQNVMMAATLARGETVIENAAREPEVVELADVLARMGAEIRGAGGDRIVVRGVTLAARDPARGVAGTASRPARCSRPR